MHQIAALKAKLAQGSIGHFEWLDGNFIKAVEYGHWILLDNVNFASASVLDRLNPLLERNGCLLINECGLVRGQSRVVKPHPDFRMFLAMDPKFGDISRAMRNRCCEIYLLSPEITSSPFRRDMLALVNSAGVLGGLVPLFMVSVHSALCGTLSIANQNKFSAVPSESERIPAPFSRHRKRFTIRNLLHWARLCDLQLCDNSFYSFLFENMCHAYMIPILTDEESKQALPDMEDKRLTSADTSIFRYVQAIFASLFECFQYSDKAFNISSTGF